VLQRPVTSPVEKSSDEDVDSPQTSLPLMTPDCGSQPPLFVDKSASLDNHIRRSSLADRSNLQSVQPTHASHSQVISIV